MFNDKKNPYYQDDSFPPKELADYTTPMKIPTVIFMEIKKNVNIKFIHKSKNNSEKYVGGIHSTRYQELL